MLLSSDGRTLLRVTNQDINLDGSITLPEGIVEIGNEAFLDCSNLKSLAIPNGVTTIGMGAFKGCSNLMSVVLPDGLTSIENEAFLDCSNLMSLVLPDGLASIGIGAFKNCSNLKSLVLPESITAIASMTFLGCRRLQKLSLPEGLITIDFLAFDGCIRLRELVFSEALTAIGNFSFRNCHSLQRLVLPKKINHIGKETFLNCSNLLALVLPKELATIDDSAFNGCSRLCCLIIASNELAECQRITQLLPEKIRDKARSEELGTILYRIIDQHCAQITYMVPELNPVYPFLCLESPYTPMAQVTDENGHSIKVECPKLSDDLLGHIHSFIVNDNLAYQAIESRILSVSLPQKEDDLINYEQCVAKVAKEEMEKSRSEALWRHGLFAQNDITAYGRIKPSKAELSDVCATYHIIP